MAVAVALAAFALILPADALARWLGSSASLQDRKAGAALFKLFLFLTAVAVMVIGVLDRREVRARSHEAAVTSPLSRRSVAAMLIILVVAISLRLVHLGAELWLDEIDTLFDHVRLPFVEILGTYTSQNQHPLYSLTARAAYLVAGQADWSIRVPAALFGVASIWMTFVFARRVAGEREALIASLLLAVSYHHVWFSQNARGYTGLLLFTLGASIFFLRLVEGHTRRPAADAWAYGVVMALGAYTHLTGALVAVGHAAALLVLLAMPRRDAQVPAIKWPAIAIVLSALLTLLLYSLTLPQVLTHSLRAPDATVSLEWADPRWLLAETLRGLGSGVPGGRIVALVAIATVVLGAMSYWKQSRAILLVMVLPIVVMAAAMIGLRHNLWPRFFFFAASFFVLLAVRGGFVVVRGILGARGEPVAIAGALGIAALSAFTVPRAWQPKQQFQRAAGYVETARSPGDPVVAIDVAAFVYERYPQRGSWHLTSSLDSLREVERGASRTWVVYTFATRLRALHPELTRHLETAYRTERVFPASVGGGSISVLVKESRNGHD